jgi:hypothetical protein
MNAKTFCLHDLQATNEVATRQFIEIGNNIADQINQITKSDRFTVRYINIRNLDPDSPSYNPDGLIGRFEVFAAVPPSSGLSFGEAVVALKAGKRVARQGWNGKGMFLFLLPASDGIPTKVIHDPALRAVIESEIGGDTFDALGSIRMFTADKKILTGWLASQTDILAEDWEILA